MTEESQPKKQMPTVQDHGKDMNILDTARYEHVQRVAKVYLGSAMIPAHFKKLEDVFVVCQMAFRMNVDPLMLLQNTYVVSGKPNISGQMAIALVNASGALKGRLKFRYEGEGDSRACTAWGIDADTGDVLECRVDMEIARGEGWIKNAKWKTMRDQMLAYRSGAWFGRMYCPDALFGLQTSEETEDVQIVETSRVISREEKTSALNQLLSAPTIPVEMPQKEEPEVVSVPMAEDDPDFHVEADH